MSDRYPVKAINKVNEELLAEEYAKLYISVINRSETPGKVYTAINDNLEQMTKNE